MSLWAYTLLAFSSLFVIVDSIGTVPAFLAMTAGDTPEERMRMARLACWVSAGILLFIALTGMMIFKLFGITLPAFQIAGSLLLLLIAHDMVRARRSAVHETAEEKEAGATKEDIAITPLAVPMLAGPGAITTTILLRNRAEGVVQVFALLASIVAVCIVSYVILRLAAKGSQWLGPIAMKIMTRLMGLLLAAVAVQFILNALRDLRPLWAGT
jgi:multiple antibiotic resistance protein